MTIGNAVEEELAPGLKYSEETGRIVRSLPVRYCYLWQAGVAEPICDLEVLSFGQRFGAAIIPSEGIGGVETLPQFRRQGHLRKVLSKALVGIAQRVAVVFVSEGIEDLYEKFGFVNCLAEAHLSVPVRNVERCAGNLQATSASNVRPFTPADLPAMVNLYNQAHAQRPWTHARQADWNRLLVTQTWQPGSEVIILTRDQNIVGYAILKEPQFGHLASAFVVEELTARDSAAAYALLVEVASRCWQMRFSEFLVHEPLDSIVGQAAQSLGCQYQQTFPPSGGMMGAILDRQRLLSLLETELRRRLPSDHPSADPADALNIAHTTAIAALQRGEVVADNRVLLRLLIGTWSMSNALAAGTLLPAQYERVFTAWFPGSGTSLLPLPYAHKLDRY